MKTPTHRRLVVTNQRGGGAKTTNAVHLALAAVEDGQRVLLVDLDPQGHTTMSISTPGEPLQYVDEALQARKAIPTPSVTPRLSILPGRLRIHELFDTSVFTGLRWDEGLGNLLAPIQEDFDLVVIDTPATFSKLHTVALRCADAYVISMRPEAFSVVGHDETRIQAEGLKAQLRLDRPIFAGYILSGVPQGKAIRRAVERIREALKAESFGRAIEIPLSVDFDECRWLDPEELREAGLHRTVHALQGTTRLVDAYSEAWSNIKVWMESEPSAADLATGGQR